MQRRRIRETVNTLYREITNLVETYETVLVRYAQSIVRDGDNARDIVQDAFIKYLDKRRQGDEMKNVKAWLYRVVYNRSIDLVRKRQRHNDLEEHVREHALPKAAQSPDEILQNKDNIEWLRNQLEQLGGKEKDVFQMKVYEEKSYKEIAEEMDMSVGHVGIILHRVMKKLSKNRQEAVGGQK
jgi:RNA polymerase sigma factor (sigma-70 family)